METIKDCLSKNNTCVVALIMFYENNRLNTKQVYRVLSCVLYSIIKNYVCFNYLSCQSKTFSFISSKLTFEKKFQYVTWY